jgi:DNA modification methylase
MTLFYKIIIGDWVEAAKLVDSNSVGLCVTSPPYIDMRGVMKWPSYEVFLEKMEKCLCEVYRVLKPGRVLGLNVPPQYIWKEKRYDLGFDLLNVAMKRCNFKLEEPIIWAKPRNMANSDGSKRFGNFLKFPYPFYYKPNAIYEFIFILTKGKLSRISMGHKSKFIKESRVLGSMIKYNSDIWELHTSSQENPWDVYLDDSAHIAMYPEILPELVIKFYSLKEDIVLDPFVGSGTTLASAKKNQRSCIAVEIDKSMLPLIKKKTNWLQRDLDNAVEYEIVEL